MESQVSAKASLILIPVTAMRITRGESMTRAPPKLGILAVVVFVILLFRMKRNAPR
jgi:hypothetical protein